MELSGAQLRKVFLDFFAKKGHIIVPSSSLIPDDSSVLLTTAGMQQFKKYYTGELNSMMTVHPTLGKPLGSYCAASVQKSFRTSDIDEVGDATHLTFFEMLGNFSFGKGAYFKKEAISYAHEFITKELGLAISYVTIFGGSKDVPKDEESRRIWQGLGMQDVREDSIEGVFWGPTGTEGPCGPTTEIYCRNAARNDIEVWNIVFNEYYYAGSREELLSGSSKKKLEKLKTPGVDTGMGLERLSMIVEKTKSVFNTDLFKPLISLLEKMYTENVRNSTSGHYKTTILSDTAKRVIVDHGRSIVFLIADGIFPSNKGAGYILRRLARRYIYRMYGFGDPSGLLKKIIDLYEPFYSELKDNKILPIFEMELLKFTKTLTKGLAELYKKKTVDAQTAFRLYESYGLPYEVIKDYAKEKAKNLSRESFDIEFKKHQEISRAGVEKKFGGHGLMFDTGELKAANEEELKKVTRLHTATHLLQAALRKVLGDGVRQMGSDITAERTRFDFSFDRKLTDDEKKQTEYLVNDVVQKGYDVEMQEMSYQDAIKEGALHFLKEKYPERVNVYHVGDFSKELCGGPHVKNTNEIGRFWILKEEAVASGIRRIRATISD